MMKFFLSFLTIALAAAAASAQGFYEDDIYFNSSKDKDKNKEAARKQALQRTATRPDGVIVRRLPDYAAADTYSFEGTSARSVDEYNRRGIFARDSITPLDTAALTQDFAYTRQIEKYYNPAVVTGSHDKALEELYYAEPANVNIYINSPGWWSGPYWSTYWGGWYDPWYGGWGSPWWNGYWGPGWAWGGPAWGWGGPYWPGWGPAWGWGPSWGPAWGWSRPIYAPGWGGTWRPDMDRRHPGVNRRPGSFSPNRGTYNPGGNWRPAYNGGNRHQSTSPNYRPGYNNSNNNKNNYNSNGNYNNYTRPGRNNSNTTNNSTWRNSGSGSNRGVFNGGGATRGGGGTGRGRH